MEAFWAFMKSTGWALTLVGVFYGFLSRQGSKCTDQMIRESREQLARSIEEARRSTQDLISNWQARWEQADQFNKRLLEKIIDKVA